MKTDRFARTVAAVLAGLLLAAGPPASAGGIRLGRVRVTLDSPSKQLAQALAVQVGVVQKRYDENRRALRPVQGVGGKPAYLQQEVAGLVAHTGEDLDQAIEKVQPSGTEPLRAWAADELGRIQGEIAASTGARASLPGLSAPYGIPVVASLRGAGPLLLASKKPVPRKPAPPKPVPPKSVPPKPAPPQPATIPAETANRLLDQVAEVVESIFVLADHDDLEVELWVGSTPSPRATFSFWPQGKIKGTTPSPNIVQAGKRKRVLRGLYSYRATWGKGAVTQLIEYPNPAGPSLTGAPGTSGISSERLDLVKGTPFFCCQFNDSYCHHVDDQKDCR